MKFCREGEVWYITQSSAKKSRLEVASMIDVIIDHMLANSMIVESKGLGGIT